MKYALLSNYFCSSQKDNAPFLAVRGMYASVELTRGDMAFPTSPPFLAGNRRVHRTHTDSFPGSFDTAVREVGLQGVGRHREQCFSGAR